MSPEEKMLSLVVLAVSAGIFFMAALSEGDSFLKAIVIVLDLSFSGAVLQKLTGAEGYYGVLMLRSRKGFGLMELVATRFGGAARQLADFGMTLAFGLPFGYYLYGFGLDNWKKLGAHAVALVAFFAWLQSMPAANSFLTQFTFVLGLLAGLAGLGLASIAVSAFGVLTVKTAPSSVAPVVPGITLPFWEGLAAIVIVAAVHELAHGVLCKVEKLKVLSTGVLLAGFLPLGAFVEPDERKLKTASIVKKRRVLAAGSTSNFLFFLVFLALYAVVAPLVPLTVSGVVVDDVSVNSSAFWLLSKGAMISSVDGRPVASTLDLSKAREGGMARLGVDGKEFDVALSNVFVTNVAEGASARGSLKPGDRIEVLNGVQVYTLEDVTKAMNGKGPGSLIEAVVAGGEKRAFPLDQGGKIGVTLQQAPAFQYSNKPRPGLEMAYAALLFLLNVIGITAFLNFALAIVNVLPLFVTDGHRIVFEELREFLGRRREKDAARITRAIALVVLIFVAINLARWFKFI